MNWLREEIGYSIEEIELIRYGAASIMMELSKFIIMLILFTVTGNGMKYLFGIFILLLLRSCSGGLHFSSYIGCLLFSIVILYMGCIFLPNALRLPTRTMLIVLLCCIAITYLTGPVLSKNRPRLTPPQIRKSKTEAIAIIFCYILTVLLFQKNLLIQEGFWIIVLQTAQLLSAYIIKGN